MLWDGLDSFCSCLRSMQLNLPLSQQINDTAENFVIGVFCVCVSLVCYQFRSSRHIFLTSDALCRFLIIHCDVRQVRRSDRAA
jgi:hypothetical protein